MKYLVQAVCAAALIGLSTNVYAQPVNGINYDPAHTQAWITAQQNNDTRTMRKLITQDLAQIKAMNFGVIKTFYSQYCPINGQNCIDVAGLAQQAGLQVMLGVREFTTRTGDGCGNDCPAWTAVQVRSAINQAMNFSPKTIIGIVVGNEDMFDFKSTPWNDMQIRIVADIKHIRAAVPNVLVTTAQRQPDWISLNQSDPNGVLATVPVIGTNIYPYWGPDQPAEKLPNGQSIATTIQPTAKNLFLALQPKGVTRVIVTEEGWPSCFAPGSMQNQNATIANEVDYYSTWKLHENQTFDSYYFATYDKQIGGGTTCVGATDANNYFGLCSAGNLTKDPSLITCPPVSATLGAGSPSGKAPTAGVPPSAPGSLQK